MAVSDKDALKALVEETLFANPHADRAGVLQEWYDANSEDQPAPDDASTEGQGAGGESKPASPTTATETGSQKGKAGK